MVKIIIKEIAGKNTYNIWLNTGNLIIAKIFTWLWTEIDFGGQKEEGIGHMINKEFNIYLWHQRE